MDGKQYGRWSTLRVEMEHSIEDFSSKISMDWMIGCVVLLSMILQLVMALGGALRYRSGSSVLQVVIWLGYMSADAVAIYALATMAHSHSREMFGIWAPILLSHLGGPDTITAYSTQDNELWLRHLLIMLYQISVAAYVVYLTQLGGYLLAASLLLLIVGVCKYAERNIALRSSSYSQIVNSADPMNAFMEHEGEKCNYLVMGLTQWREGREARVTIHNVWEFEGKKLTENYLLCLSHALFKIIMRRCVYLYVKEKSYNTTRKFFFAEELSHISPEKIFTVAEMELKYLYDFLFSKSSGTAFSKVGTVMRLVNMCLLGVTGFLIYSELRAQRDKALYTQRVLAYVLLSVTLVLEMVQFFRIWASDWTMVWLTCARIQHTYHCRGRIGLDFYMAMLMQIAIQISSWFRKLCKGKYWRGEIPQYSLIDTCSHLSRRIWKLAQFLRLTGFVTYWYTTREPIGDDLKSFIIEKIQERCLAEEDEEEDVEKCRTRLTDYNSILEENNRGDLSWASEYGHEFLILRWHIATTICEMQYNLRESGAESSTSVDDEERVKKNVGVSSKLSRYCAYLLVSTAKLLPLHPQGAHVRHMDVHNELMELPDLGCDKLKSYRNENLLRDGANLALELQQMPEQQRWKIISDYWGGLMIFYAMKNKASIHVKRLPVGGEFLTLLWAIVGHMGVGDQWETSGL